MIKISYAKQFILEKNIQDTSKVLRGNFITQGPQTLLFQSSIKKFCKGNIV